MRGFGSAQMGDSFELVVRTAQGTVQTLEVRAADASAACANAIRDGLQAKWANGWWNPHGSAYWP
jgi:hypothetical protein